MEQMRSRKRKYWTPEEDDKLIEYVNTHGLGNWKKAAESIGIEKKRSCSQRYNNHLSPELVHGDFTGKEKDKIETLRAIWGNKWAFIARQLPGRTANAVKNWYHKQLAKEARDLKQALPTPAAPPQHPPPGEVFEGYNHQFINSGGSGSGGAGFWGYNHQFANSGGASACGSGAGFGDSNQQFLNCGGSRAGGSATGFGDYNQQFLTSGGSSGAGFEDYNQQFLNSSGAGFEDYNHQFLNSSGAGFGDYNEQFLNSSGAGFGDYIVNSGGGGGGGSASGSGAVFGDYNENFLNSDGAVVDDLDIDQFLNYSPTTDNHPPGGC